MSKTKPLIVSALIGGVIATSLAASAVVSAENTGGNGRDNLIQKIAQRFNLNEVEVEAVFEENRAERQAERKQKLEEKLAQAVEEGKLTAEQKDKLIAKHQELQAQREADHESMINRTHKERRAEMEAKRSELEQWAEENDIPIEYLFFGHRHGRGSHKGLIGGSDRVF